MKNSSSRLEKGPMTPGEAVRTMQHSFHLSRLVGVTLLLLAWVHGAEEKTKKSASRSKSAPMEIEFGSDETASSKSVSDTSKFEELNFEKSVVIEAKVERPQVQFPLLKEAPPEKAISFEASFRDQLLEAPRENTFQLK
jgi:hypothetical protein